MLEQKTTRLGAWGRELLFTNYSQSLGYYHGILGGYL
jgi:hypothetical protein